MVSPKFDGDLVYASIAVFNFRSRAINLLLSKLSTRILFFLLYDFILFSVINLDRPRL